MKKHHLQLGVLIITLFVCCVVWNTHPAYAIREPRPNTLDGRVKTLVYRQDEVFKFTGFFYVQSILEFDRNEAITNVSIGLPQGWQVNVVGHRIFIKPITEDKEGATTNMTVITDKRMYFFELYADEATTVNDQRIPFIVRFVYPEKATAGTIQQVASSGPNLSDLSKFNFNYTISGNDTIAPLKVFDDHQFTYFQFRKNSPIPGIFEIDPEGYEGVINYRVEGDYIVVEDVTSQMTLRYGPDVVCVFNESRPLPPPPSDDS